MDLKYVYRRLLSLPLYEEHERVFLILGGKILSLHEVPNVADEPNWRFRTLHADVCRVVRKTGRQKIGFIHTHPDPRQADPSIADRHGAKPHLIYAVYQPLRRRLRWYSHRDLLRPEYLPHRIRR